MSERWHIFKDGRQIGPLSASEIRRGLREGEFDPFDLVAREGSNLRRELVEVDELFFTSKVVYGDEMKVAEANASTQQLNATHSPFLLSAGSTSTAGSALSAGQGAYVPVFGPTSADSSRKSQPRAQAPMLGQGHMALADEASAEQATVASNVLRVQVVRRQRDPKHFLLTNGNGRVIGPMSATEVQSLYYRGVLPGNVSVMRQGSDAKVTLSRFISVMSGNRNPKAQRQGAHPVSGMHGLMQKKALFTSAPFGIQPVAAMALVAAFTLFLATGLLLIEHKTGKLSSLANKFGHTQNLKSGKRKDLKARRLRSGTGAAAAHAAAAGEATALKGRAARTGGDAGGGSEGVPSLNGRPPQTGLVEDAASEGAPALKGRRSRSGADDGFGDGANEPAAAVVIRPMQSGARPSPARPQPGATGAASPRTAATPQQAGAPRATAKAPPAAGAAAAAPTAAAPAAPTPSAAQVAAAQAAFIRGEATQAPAPVTQIAQPQKSGKDRRAAAKAAAAKGAAKGRPAAKFRRDGAKMKFKPLPRGK